MITPVTADAAAFPFIAMTDKNLEQTLVLIKPDALKNSLTGYVLSQFSEFHTGLRLAAAKIVHVSKMLAEEHEYDPGAGERVEWCRCGYPASRVRSDALREPLTDLLGFEQSASNATTYYCPSCDTRRVTVAT